MCLKQEMVLSKLRLHYTDDDIIPAEWTLLTYRLYWSGVKLPGTQVQLVPVVSIINAVECEQTPKCIFKHSSTYDFNQSWNNLFTEQLADHQKM